MAINSRDKGKRGELELSKFLREHGYPNARRGQQYSGVAGDADVVGVQGLHIECKRVERLNLHEAMAQAKRDAREDSVPVVMHRRNNTPWLATLELDDFLDIYGHGNNVAETKERER